MDRARRLKWGAIAFTVFWTIGMLWWSGEYHPANVIILSACRAGAGYFWYRAMHWSFRRMRLLPHGGIDTGAER